MLLWMFLQFIRLLQEASKGQRADTLTPQQRREKCAPSGLGPFFVFPHHASVLPLARCLSHTEAQGWSGSRRQGRC